MTTYLTGNPLGSADPRDLYDNAQVIDDYANSAGDTTTDRLGVERVTIAGIDAAARSAIANAGYEFVGDYAAGIELTAYNQVVREAGEFWRVSGAIDLPYTTTGAGLPEGGAFVTVGDAALRQDLVQPVATFNNVQDMKDAAGLDVGRKVRTLGYYAPGDGGGNDYEIVASGTGTDDGGSFIDLAGSGTQAKGLHGARFSVLVFGADNTGNSNSHNAINNAFVYLAKAGGGTILVPSGQYLLNGTLRMGSNTSLISENGVTYRKNHPNSFLHNSVKSDGTVYNNTDNFPAYSGVSNIVIDGGVWAGFSEGIYESYTGFALGYGSDITLKNLTLLDTISGGHGIDMAGCRNVLFENCKFLGQSVTEGSEESTKEIIQIDHDVDGSFGGLYFNTPQYSGNKNITLRDCVFGPNPDNTDIRFGPPNIPMGAHGSVHDVWHENITIDNCKFEGSLYAAIREWKWKNLVVTNSHFNGGARALHSTPTSEGSTSSLDADRVQTNQAQYGIGKYFSNCTFEGFTDTAILTTETTLTTNTEVRHEDISFVSCVIKNCAQDAFRVRQVRRFKVSDCTVRDNGRAGFWCLSDGDQIKIENSTFENHAHSGVLQFSTARSTSIKGNTIKGCNDRAIFFTGSNDQFVVADNYISNWAGGVYRAAIVAQTSSKNGVIHHNHLSDPGASFTGDFYIQASGTTANIEIYDNWFDDLTKYAAHQSVGGICVFRYDGNPEGVIQAWRGSVCRGEGGATYIKRSTAGDGRTGWHTVDTTSQ